MSRSGPSRSPTGATPHRTPHRPGRLNWFGAEGVTFPRVKTRRWVPWTLVGGLGVLVSAAAVQSAMMTHSIKVSTRPTLFVPVTGFGGYIWRGTTHEIAAQWVVPTILGITPDASASTWIGAQDRLGGAFVQLGTIEEERALPASPLDWEPHYLAFWSDTSLGFRARSIGVVFASDRVSADMVRKPTGWVLMFSDSTKGWNRTIDTRYGDKQSFSEGEWLQEDPAVSLRAAADLPYPMMTSTLFYHLTINGHRPGLSYRDARILLATGGIFMVPTVIYNDAFALNPAQGAAREYLADVAQFAAQVEGFLLPLSERGSRISNTERQSDLAKVFAAYEAFDAQLSSQDWPSSVEGNVIAVVLANERFIHDLRRYGPKLLSARDLGPESARFGSDLQLLIRAEAALHAKLGLPPT